MEGEERHHAWYTLGTPLPEGITAEKALEHANLAGWGTRRTKMTAVLPDGTNVSVPDYYAVVRQNPLDDTRHDVLGVVGKNYHVVRNEALVRILEALSVESGAVLESAGELNGGSIVFFSMKLPSHTLVGGVDQVDHYIAITSSHDGSIPTAVSANPVRNHSQGTMNIPLGSNHSVFRFRHTISASRYSNDQVSEALDQIFEYYDAFGSAAEELFEKDLEEYEFESILLREFGPKSGSSNATVTRRENMIEGIMEEFSGADLHSMMHETAWAGLSALVDWSDFIAPVRPGVEGEQYARARRAVLDPWFKNEALKLIQRG